jgi:hypothetical protein
MKLHVIPYVGFLIYVNLYIFIQYMPMFGSHRQNIHDGRIYGKMKLINLNFCLRLAYLILWSLILDLNYQEWRRRWNFFSDCFDISQR